MVNKLLTGSIQTYLAKLKASLLIKETEFEI